MPVELWEDKTAFMVNLFASKVNIFILFCVELELNLPVQVTGVDSDICPEIFLLSASSNLLVHVRYSCKSESVCLTFQC